MSDILPTGYTSIDLSQGGRTAYSGAVSGTEQGVVVEPLYYPDSEVSGQWYRRTEAFSDTEEFYALERKMRAWTLDWIDLKMVVPTGSAVVSVGFYKKDVGDQDSDIVSGDRLGELITFNTATAGERGVQNIRLSCYNLSDLVRRFEPGQSLVVGFDLSTGTLSLTEIEISWLGRTYLA